MQTGGRSLEVELPGEHGAVAGDDRNAEAASALRDQKIAHDRPGRRQQAPRRRIRGVFESVIAAVDTH
jgi:hypothetical protein